MKGLDEKQALCAFPMSLTGNASRWYYNLSPSKTKVWNDLVDLFVDQFIFNTVIDVTLKDLETTKQGFNETFSKYMVRWKSKVSRMVNRPNEKDHINMIIKNLLLAYNNRLLSSPINSFAELCDCGTRIEDAINTGQLDLSEAKFQAKKVFNEGEKGGALNNVNVLTRLQKRVFDDLQMPLSEVLAVLNEVGHLKPLDPTPLPNPIPPNWNRNDHYAFLQRIGHKTNSCLRLKHEVKDLIDQGVIAKPQPQEMSE